MYKHFAAFLFVLLTATLQAQGPLAPPGTPAPMMRTLDQVFDVAKGAAIAVNQENTPGDADAVFVISQPGSYYLPKSFTGETGKYGIQVTTSNVVLDLGGNCLTGVAGALKAVSCQTESAVRNGTIRSWPGGGVQLGGGGRVRDLTVQGCGSVSIWCGFAGIITDCIVENADFVAISVDESSIVERCVALQTSGNAIVITDTCIVRDCVVRTATFSGINQGSGANCIIERNAITFASEAGITVCADCQIRDNAIYSCQKAIDLRCGGSVVSGNTLSENTTGVTLSDNNKEQVFNNTFRGNTTNVQSNTGNYIAPIVAVSSATNPFSNLLAQ